MNSVMYAVRAGMPLTSAPASRRSSAIACWTSSTTFTTLALPRPPDITSAFTTPLPPHRSSASRISGRGALASRCSGTGRLNRWAS
jgi:hypothetical protein